MVHLHLLNAPQNQRQQKHKEKIETLMMTTTTALRGEGFDARKAVSDGADKPGVEDVDAVLPTPVVVGLGCSTTSGTAIDWTLTSNRPMPKVASTLDEIVLCNFWSLEF